MKFAIVPDRDEYKNDKMFDVNDSEVNRDHLAEPIYEMKLLFEEKGDELHTIDLYESLDEIDYFLFFRLEWSWVDKIVGAGKGNRMVYCTAEPPSVDEHNTLRSYKKLSKIFPYILTWNDEWIDNRGIFKRINPYFFVDERINAKSFNDKKLVTFISGNKSSDFKGELYSERRRAIDFFEKNYPQEFDFYGVGWDKDEHICYGGKVDDKYRVFHNYRFAICYENIMLPGYVTEKIFDCLVSGIVPIYAGAPNISDYIPGDCYIDFKEFENYEELSRFLLGMDELDYNQYLLAADKYLKSDRIQMLGGNAYGRYIYSAIKCNKDKYMSSRTMRYWYIVWFAIYKRLLKYKLIRV